MSSPTSRTALVTGATGAIGYAICEGLARTPGFSVVLIGRDEPRTRQAAGQIRRDTGNEQVRYDIADLSRQQEIAALAARWEGGLNVLINNAAVTPPRRRETPEGIELQFATNVLGYFWMTQAFTPILAATATDASPARIVDVASYYAGDLHLDDLQFERRPYDNRRAYRQSKQANRMLVAAFAPRLAPHNITINACHPGDVNSSLSNNLGFGGSESPARGAATPIWLATSDDVAGQTGQYFADRRRQTDPFGNDKEAVERLFDICRRFSPLTAVP